MYNISRAFFGSTVNTRDVGTQSLCPGVKLIKNRSGGARKIPRLDYHYRTTARFVLNLFPSIIYFSAAHVFSLFLSLRVWLFLPVISLVEKYEGGGEEEKERGRKVERRRAEPMTYRFSLRSHNIESRRVIISSSSR